MTAIFTIIAVAGGAFIAHLVYGAILAGREYQSSEQAWANAADRLIPKRIPVQRAARVGKPRLQGA